MAARFSLAIISITVLTAAGLASAQAPASGPGMGALQWRRAGTAMPASTARTTDSSAVQPASGSGAVRKSPAPSSAVTGPPQKRIARVTAGSGRLPTGAGQVWRDYDISPYTLRVTTTNRPEQALIDWILRETGYEAWHSEPLGILNASRRTLRVYHTREMQARVAAVVDRFVGQEAESRAFGIQVITVDHPSWRGRAQRLLRPIAVQTPGVQAWLLQKEDASVLLSELKRRTDYREHSSPHLLVNDGQSTVVSSLRERTYIRSVTMRPDVWPGFESEKAHIDEGFSLEFSPLSSVDGKTIDAVIKCNIDQVEKMVPVMVEVPTSVSPRQRSKIEVPQITHFRFHERFRWPVDHVLLVGMGMVALPVPAEGKSLLPGIPLPLPSSPARADLLVLVESKAKGSQPATLTQNPRPAAKKYRGRY